MPLNVGYDEITRILASYYRDGGEELSADYGDQGPDLAEEMAGVLDDLLPGQTPFGPMWEEFKQNPEETEPELIGALEMLEESVPEITIRLEGYYAAFEKLAQPGEGDLMETPEPEATIDIEEIKAVRSIDDMDDDDEYMEENEYLTGNVEDRSTSAMYYEDLDSSVEPNESEDE